MRHPLGRRALVTIATVGLLASCAQQTTDERPAATGPSIVFVLFDDADAASVERLPRIRELASQGASFTRFYATEPICCPSRASILTGEYVHNHGVSSNTDRHGGGYPAFREHGHEQRSLARTLQERGYRTGLFGKYLNQYGPESRSADHMPPYWDRWLANFDYRRNTFQVNDQGRVQRRSTYIDTLIVEEARAWLAQTEGASFTFVSVIAPHAPYRDEYDPPDHEDAASDDDPPSLEKQSFDEEDVSDKPAYVRDLAPLDDETIAEIREEHVHRMRMMLNVDEQLGDLIDELEGIGRFDDTYVFVTSDNGWMLGEHRLPRGKLYPYEESARLPLFVRGPGIEAGTTIDELTSIVDLFATFADIAGSGERRDGRSLVPLLEGQEPPWRSVVLLENEGDLPRLVPDYSGVVTRQHKYIRYATGETELYDLAADPHETENLAAESGDLVAELDVLLDELLACAGDDCRVADAPAAVGARP